MKIRVLILATRVPVVEGDGTPSFVLDNSLPLAEEFSITIVAPRVRGARRVTQRGAVTVKRFAYFPRKWESLAEDAIIPQLTLRPYLWLQGLALTCAMILATAKEIRVARPDVIHAQWLLPAGLVGLLADVVWRIPYLVTSQGADAFRLEAVPLRALKRHIVARAGFFVGVSEDISQRFVGVSNSVITQPSGIDFAFWERVVGLRKPERETVVFVGRLASKKGVDTAIRAVSRSPNMVLRIIGDGPERPRLERQSAELGLQDRVVFLGTRSRQDIAVEFRTATCVVIPSVTSPDGDRDGTPNVLGEAVAAGVPVIASRIAGLDELLRDGQTGLLHDPGDDEKLEYCISRLVEEPSLGESLSENAKRELREKLDLPRVAAKYATWYRELVSCRK